MARNSFIVVLMLIITFFSRAAAQEVFTEGCIRYKVEALAPGTSSLKQLGYYTITVKGNMVRKEFALENGYKNVLLYNGSSNTYYSLKSTSGNNYAIQLNVADLNAQYKKYEGFKLAESAVSTTIAGQTCTKAVITYTDNTTSNISIYKDFTPSDAYIFEHFPGIKYVPLYFEYATDQGNNLHFTAEKIEKAPQESSQFRVPHNYKIISNEEYKSLSK
jgi:hypothetical protein